MHKLLNQYQHINFHMGKNSNLCKFYSIHQYKLYNDNMKYWNKNHSYNDNILSNY